MSKRTVTLGVLIVALLVAITALPVMAARPIDVHIENLTDISGAPSAFTASGPCRRCGDYLRGWHCVESARRSRWSEVRRQRFLYVEKRFVCGDGSGTFDMKMPRKAELDHIVYCC